MDDETVARGVELLARLEHDELDLAEVMDRIELVTDEPRLQQRILREAEQSGYLEREETTVRPRSDVFLSFESEVTSKDGHFDCRRCGAELSTGYFVQLPSGELGPFGSSCIRKVTGRA